MTFFNPLTTIENEHKWDRPYKGKVVAVDDTKQIGRIKVSIPELFGEYTQQGDKDSSGILPWIYPRYYGDFIRPFSVPDLGDIVEVEFPYRNPYIGYYTNKPVFTEKLDPVFLTNYPNTYGNMDRNRTGYWIDRSTDIINFLQGTTGMSVMIDSEGTTNVYIPKDLNIIVEGNWTSQVKGDQKHTVEGSQTEEVTGDVTRKISGTRQCNISGTDNLTVPTLNIKGNTVQTGSITASLTIKSAVDCIGKTVSLVGHTHPYSWTHDGGASNTSPPNQ